MTRPVVIPALLASNYDEFRRKVKVISGCVALAQIDVMDGQFVRPVTFYDSQKISRLRTPLKYELHLMVKNPAAVIKQWRGSKKIKRVYVQAEAGKTLPKLFAMIHKEHWQVGLAVSPATSLAAIEPLVSSLDTVMFLGDRPGYGRPRPRPAMIKRAASFHRRHPRLPIAFDIGVNDQSAAALRRAGVSLFVSGGFIFHHPQPAKAIRQLATIIT